MVKCFLIHTLCPVSTLSAKESRILYCRVFEPTDRLSGMNTDIIPEERRLLEKEKLATIARQVQSTCSLCREARGQLSAEPVLGEEARALEEADSGMLRLPVGDPFPEEHFLLWLGVSALGFSMVCHADENLLLAEGALRSLASHCLESLRLLAPGSEVLLKSDRIEALLHHLVPHGQLLFINHRFAQSLDKELTACLAK